MRGALGPKARVPPRSHPTGSARTLSPMTRPGLARRPDLHPHRRRLALPRRRIGSAYPQDRRLVDARDAAHRNRIGGAHHGDRATTPATGTDPPLRSRHSAAEPYRLALARSAITPSMSRKGDCLDNAPMESFFHSLKTERVHHRIYGTRAEARRDLFLYIEGFYNSRRLHSALGYVSPAFAERMAA